MEVNPIAVILVYMDSKGDRLLYRYPYQADKVVNQTTAIPTTIPPNSAQRTKKRNPFAIASVDNLLQTQPQKSTNICALKGLLQGFTDEALSTLFAVKQQLCNQKFELKINDVRFVSHPTMVQRNVQAATNLATAQSVISISAAGASGGGASISAGGGAAAPTAQSTGTTVPASALTPLATTSTMTGSTTTIATTSAAGGAQKTIPQQMLINIVFALQARASYSIVKCYYELSKRLGLALKVEEQRCGYLTEEVVQMARTHDEMQQQPIEQTLDVITEKCGLAQALKTIYHDLCTTGLLNTTLNQNITLCFCLPQKAHQMHKKGSMVDPETIDRCLRSLKPYHGMLLLVDFAELLDCVPPPAARMLLQLVEVYTPLMSLQSMASDADLNIEYVYKLVSHLVYWAKATIIYPLCETNVYVIAPDAPLYTKSHLAEKFSTRFAGMSLFEVIADFSLPTSIGHLTTPLQQPARQGILAQMVLWMLQHHLLLQLHTYVQFMPSNLNDELENDILEVAVETSSSLMDLNEVTPESLVHSEEDILMRSKSANASDDDLNAAESLLSISSQPLPVPNTSRRSITEDRFSGCGSNTSDNVAAQPSSSHKSIFSITASISTENCDSIASMEDEDKIKELLQVFDESDRVAIRRIPASMNVDDLSLLVKLYQAGYFKSEHHLEEIMYFENLRRSQLLQLLDKFRDVLVIYETEDPAIATLYNNKSSQSE